MDCWVGWPEICVVPLHFGEVPSGDRWACAEPERPYDGHVWFEWRCRPCYVYGRVTVAVNPGRVVMGRAHDEMGRIARTDLVSLVECVRQAKAWHADHGYQPISR